ncbi:MAG TPA: FAD-dependent oxidoreductase [Bryobacteraceae bacterium]|nr:FAD-dependent oxidoreductase [Bryobacteraceae bacterium]
MLSYLLARAGVPVIALEKHADFFRDFRGDTVHCSTFDLFHELGLLEDLLIVPHQELRAATAIIGGARFRAADFTRVPACTKFIALMPQWDFLSFLSEKARQYPSFDLRMRHEAVGLIREGGRVAGVQVRTGEGETLEIRADLVVACDGRHSTLRNGARMPVTEFGVPIDVLWFRLSRRADDPEQLLGNVNYGKFLILLNRGDYFQAGIIIRKGAFETLQERGLEAFRRDLAQVAPFLGDRVNEVTDWEQIRLLTVKINRVHQWRQPGLLLIGDAAHAMSPAWGVGINLAIQDSVVAARLLTRPLLERRVTEADLARVQERREFPVRVTQWLQTLVHNQMDRLFDQPGPFEAPWQVRALLAIPAVPHLVGRFVGMGIRPGHIGEPAKPAPTRPDKAGRRKPLITVCAGIAAAAVVFTVVRLWRLTDS